MKKLFLLCAILVSSLSSSTTNSFEADQNRKKVTIEPPQQVSHNQRLLFIAALSHKSLKSASQEKQDDNYIQDELSSDKKNIVCAMHVQKNYRDCKIMKKHITRLKA